MPDRTGDRQRLVVLCGLPGVGKSSVAELVTARLDARRFRTDVIRKELVTEPTYSATETERVYEELHDRAQTALDAGESVVLDGTFIREQHRSLGRELAAAAGVQFTLLRVVCEQSVVEQRIAERDGISDADRSVYRQLRAAFEPIERDHAVVDNSGTLAETRAQVEQLF